MEITKVNITLAHPESKQVLGFASIVFDNSFLIRGIRIIDNGEEDTRPFLAMPNRYLTRPCVKCRTQNWVMNTYCGACGVKLPDVPLPVDRNGRKRTNEDCCYPIRRDLRKQITELVLAEYDREIELKRQRGGYATAKAIGGC